jgi:hypothetical protein
MISSVRATLYVPYIHCPPGSGQVVQRFQKVALHRIKTASYEIASHCFKISEVSKVGEEFMVGMYVTNLGPKLNLTMLTLPATP